MSMLNQDDQEAYQAEVTNATKWLIDLQQWFSEKLNPDLTRVHVQRRRQLIMDLQKDPVFRNLMDQDLDQVCREDVALVDSYDLVISKLLVHDSDRPNWHQVLQLTSLSFIKREVLPKGIVRNPDAGKLHWMEPEEIQMVIACQQLLCQCEFTLSDGTIYKPNREIELDVILGVPDYRKICMTTISAFIKKQEQKGIKKLQKHHKRLLQHTIETEVNNTEHHLVQALIDNKKEQEQNKQREEVPEIQEMKHLEPSIVHALPLIAS
jgi:hypothetical protein